MANLIDFVLKGKTSKAQKEVKDARQEIKALASEITLTIKSIKKIASAFDKITDTASDYAASLRLLNATMGKTAGTATTFVKRLSEMSGLDENVLTKQVAKFYQLGESLNLSNEYSEKFSENLSILSTKLAMLYNTDYSTMSSTIQKAIQGTQTTLKAQTGISLNEAAIQATLNANAINRQVSSLNDAELALAKYATILRQVTSDNNVYQEAVNSLAWQKQMLSAQVKRLATAIGQFLTPVMTKLYTIANAIVMVFTEIISLLAGLVGATIKQTNNVADASSGYKALGSSIKGASNEAKKSLRSFDKLNNITTPSAGGSGGGGGIGIDRSMLGLLSNINDDFLNIRTEASRIRDKIMEWLGFTKEIDELTGLTKWKYQGFGTTIKNIWEWFKKLNTVQKILVGLGTVAFLTNVWKILGKIYNLMGGAGITKLLSGMISPLKTAFSTFLGKGTEVLSMASRIKLGIAGMFEIGASFGLFIDAFKSIRENGFNVINILETIGATILGIVGTVSVLTAAFGAFNPWFIAIGGVVAGIGALVGWFTTQDKKVEESTKVLSEYERKLQEVKEAQKEETQQLESKVGRVKALQKELAGLVNENGKVVGSHEKVASILSTLNELLGTEYKITGDQITLNGKNITSYDSLKKSIDSYCSALRTESYLEIKRKEYNTRLERQLELQKQIDEENEKVMQSQKRYDTTSQDGIVKWLAANGERLESLKRLKSEYKTNAQYVEAYETAAYEASQKHYTESERLLTKEFENVSVSMQDVAGEFISKIGGLPQQTKKPLAEVSNQIAGVKREASDIKISVNADMSNAKRQIKTFFGNLITTITPRLSGYADGGFVKEGELFMAREAGPELVGTINGHSAVANNDQIIKGIQGGVFNAMMSALKGADFGGKTVIEAKGDTEGLLNFITFKQKQKDRQYN